MSKSDAPPRDFADRAWKDYGDIPEKYPERLPTVLYSMCSDYKGANHEGFCKRIFQLAYNTLAKRVAELERYEQGYGRWESQQVTELKEELATANEVIEIKSRKIDELRRKIALQEQIMDESRAEIERLKDVWSKTLQRSLEIEQSRDQANERIETLSKDREHLQWCLNSSIKREQKLVAALNSIWSIANAQGFTVIRKICDESLKTHKGGA